MITTDRRILGLATLAALLVAATACTESPTALRQGAAAYSRVGSLGQGRHFNSEKYRDSGAKPAIGRSGAAALAAEALQDEGGGITLQVTSHRAADLSTLAGDMSRIQVKAFAASGRLLFTRNYPGALVGNTLSVSYAGLPPGVTFQVQANVGGLDRNRTDVVTVNPRAGRRPDLAVTAIAAAATAIVNTPVIISATIAELNGFHGARADCGLFVDGARVDRADGIWVDAGDAVSCVFTYTFATTGDERVEVRIAHVTPADADPSNNVAMTHISVLAPDPTNPGPTFSFFADIRDVVFESADTFSTTWTFPSGALFLEQSSAFSSSGTDQSALFNGTISAQLSFPIARIDVAQTSGGQLLHSARYDQVAPDPNSSVGADCAVREELGTGVSFFICSQSLGFTTITYLRSAGTVTFESMEFSKVWNGESFDEFTFTDNGSTSTGLLLPWGSTFTFNVTITDGTIGSTVYSAATTVPLGPVSTSIIEPKTCASGTASVPPDVLNTFTCLSSLFSETGTVGTVSGSGTTVFPPTP
ncbi:MAG: hypothetical protein HYR48_04630 [Gemmatimonadetes bacterium]|nr:hypothetical protein [Gemmatimonadota bacterium]